MSKYTTSIEYENDESYITFPEEMLEELGWDVGDTLSWKDNGDGTYSITKVERKNYAIQLKPNNLQYSLICRCCNIEIEPEELSVYVRSAPYTPIRLCIPCAKSIGELVVSPE